ncbi:hypothetical protein [Leptolyngbya ohadii]|uniref:hypothetical protein n=1 Tax=Leptolyngbya ohadii TaxID=1962290 RepID=UPI0021F19C3E|nr:hypothetical protein [Leptolyngbya ohadii]
MTSRTIELPDTESILNEAAEHQNMKGLIQYFYQLKLGKAVLWCYLIWYVVIVCFYFDSSPGVWINAVGVSAIIGTGLMFSVTAHPLGKRDHWQTLRLYLMPFCVSSFSALIKDQGFIVFIPPRTSEFAVAVLCCMLFLSAVAIIKTTKRN